MTKLGESEVSNTKGSLYQEVAGLEERGMGAGASEGASGARSGNSCGARETWAGGQQDPLQRKGMVRDGEGQEQPVTCCQHLLIQCLCSGFQSPSSTLQLRVLSSKLHSSAVPSFISARGQFFCSLILKRKRKTSANTLLACPSAPT